MKAAVKVWPAHIASPRRLPVTMRILAIAAQPSYSSSSQPHRAVKRQARGHDEARQQARGPQL